MTPILWRVTAALALVCALIAAVLIYGQKQYRAGHVAATAHISAELAKSVTEREAADYQAAKAAAENKEQVRYEQVQKTIVRDVYHSHCIDADGLHIINQAVAGSH